MPAHMHNAPTTRCYAKTGKIGPAGRELIKSLTHYLEALTAQPLSIALLHFYILGLQKTLHCSNLQSNPLSSRVKFLTLNHLFEVL